MKNIISMTALGCLFFALTGCQVDRAGAGTKIIRHEDGTVQITAPSGSRWAKRHLTITTEAYIRHCKLNRSSFPAHESNLSDTMGKMSPVSFEAFVKSRVKTISANPTICLKPKAS